MNAFLADGQGLATIVDDEPGISIGHATVAEGNAGTVTATFTVTLSAAFDRGGVGSITPPRTAARRRPARLPGQGGTLMFAPGQTTATITVLVYGDRVAESDESFSVILSNPTPNAHSSPAPGATARSWTTSRAISVDDVTRNEGNSGVTLLHLHREPVGRLRPAGHRRTTPREDGTATAGSDYQATPGTLTFAPGETTKTVTVAVYGDTPKESHEYFYLCSATPAAKP